MDPMGWIFFGISKYTEIMANAGEKESPTKKIILLVTIAGKGIILKIFRFMKIYMFDIQKHPMPAKLMFIQQNIQQLMNIRMSDSKGCYK